MQAQPQTSHVIRVDADVRSALDKLRSELGLGNYSAAIRMLLEGRA